LWGNQDDVVYYADSACNKYGGLKAGSLAEIKSLRRLELSFWGYECNGPTSRQTDIPSRLPVPVSSPVTPVKTDRSPPAKNKNTVDEAKEKCASLGFKPGTERFSDCALELIQ
jgi:hypothetical protein